MVKSPRKASSSKKSPVRSKKDKPAVVAAPVVPAAPEVITAYKGFDKDLRCRGFQFEIGKTFEHNGEVRACHGGFHACEHPLDVFNYYPPASSRFAVVTQSGSLSRHNDDTKIASAKITVEAELRLSDLIERAVKWVVSRAKPEKGGHATGDSGAASATGDRGAASATGVRGAASATGVRGAASATGYSGAASATGVRGAASATGVRGAASATGDSGAASATGYSGAAMASGQYGRVHGAEGCALFLVYRDPFNGNILHAWAGIAGRDGIKPLTWYKLNEHGQPVETTAP